ncbi:D-amino-acid transaminase [Celeribacter arenosi]|uniref:Probable branched-chain-amino-acid aminotransferase n=1 Tax=Celeribacter arenosi TaxID=792649 RepID=A0ABP7K0Y4_9RHOB
MSQIVYVNGDYVAAEDAKVSVFDRGFLMADAVYEVTSVIGGKLVDFDGHATRLQRSMSELEMVSPVTMEDLLEIHRQLVARNDLDEGGIYLQITRGAPDSRDFVWPDPDEVKCGIVLFTFEKALVDSKVMDDGIKVISMDDIRWGRRDIKTTQLLYPSFAKMQAKKAGAADAWLVEDGFVTEGTANNAYIVKDGTIITRQLGNDILHGITRAAILRFAKEAQMQVEERPFTIEEAQAADEAFVTSATGFAQPVIDIDGATIGTGKPGSISKRLREIYTEEMTKAAI